MSLPPTMPPELHALVEFYRLEQCHLLADAERLRTRAAEIQNKIDLLRGNEQSADGKA